MEICPAIHNMPFSSKNVPCSVLKLQNRAGFERATLPTVTLKLALQLQTHRFVPIGIEVQQLIIGR